MSYVYALYGTSWRHDYSEAVTTTRIQEGVHYVQMTTKQAQEDERYNETKNTIYKRSMYVTIIGDPVSVFVL